MARAAGVVIKEIDALLDELAESMGEPLPATAVCDAVKDIGAVRNRVEAAFTKLVGWLDSSQAFQEDNARGARVWLRAKLHLPKAVADQAVRASRDLRRMPHTAEMFDKGGLTSSHVTMMRLAHDANPDEFAADETELLRLSQELWHDHFTRAVKHWIYVHNSDDEEDKARKRYEGRHFYLSQSFEDTWDLRGNLDVISGAIVKREVDRLEQLMFQADWQAAEARLGRKPFLDELDRTPAQRRADALAEMARRSLSLTDGAPRSRPLVTVVIDHPSLERVCQLADGTVVTPGEILPLFCDCDIERVVFGADSRVVDVGVRRRFFTGATRRAVEIRDLECTNPMCDVPYEDCEIDHIRPWPLGGPTTQNNGRCACKHHNRSRPRSQLPNSDHDPPTRDW